MLNFSFKTYSPTLGGYRGLTLHYPVRRVCEVNPAFLVTTLFYSLEFRIVGTAAIKLGSQSAVKITECLYVRSQVA
jgi:hypothetical protein